jgi:hypothetical protein
MQLMKMQYPLRSSWWASVIPEISSKTLEQVMTWATNAECDWWIVAEEVDHFPCLRMVFHTPVPVTRRFVAMELEWNTHFQPLDFEVSSDHSLSMMLKNPDKNYWASLHKATVYEFANVLNSPPNGKVHLVHTNGSLTKHIQSQLHRNKIYVIRLGANTDPFSIVDRVHHLALTSIIVIVHGWKIKSQHSNCLCWKVNKYNTRIIVSQ